VNQLVPPSIPPVSNSSCFLVKSVLAVVLSLVAIDNPSPRENASEDEQAADYDPRKCAPRGLVADARVIAGVPQVALRDRCPSHPYRDSPQTQQP